MIIEKSWILTDRQLCDCELILDGSFSPLDRFMTESDYDSVLENMRLSSGELFSLPIVLDVDEQFAGQLSIGEKILLREKEGFKIAHMNIESIWKPDFDQEAKLVYGTKDKLHPAVNYMFDIGNKIYVGGKIEKIAMPNHYDYRQYRLSPEDAKNKFQDNEWGRIIASI